MPVFTIRTEASDVKDLEAEYPYQYWIADDQCLILSKVELEGDTLSAGNGVLIKNPTTGAWVSTVTTTYYSLYAESYTTGDFIRLYYNDVTGWEAWLPDQVRRTATNWTIYYSAYGSGTLPTAVYTNGVSLPSPFTSAGSTLPSDIPSLESVDDAINNALNATTSTTTQANTIQSTVNSNLHAYENGQISSSEMQEVINQSTSDLETLNNNASNTLADQIAINNAQNAVQIAQDKVISEQLLEYLKSQNLFGDFWDMAGMTPDQLIQEITTEILNSYREYVRGNITKEEAIYTCQQIMGLSAAYESVAIQMGVPLTEADRYFLKQIEEVNNQVMDNINNAGDVDQYISDAAESSDQAEKEYLDSLTSETTASIQDISPKDSFTDVEMGTAQEVLSIIWENKLVKRLLVICGCFMVVCVVLGIRYKV